MATKAFYIELRVTGVDSNERVQAVSEALQRAGRQLHADVTLICGDTTPPQIELYGEDLIDGRQEIKIVDPS